MRDRLTGGDRHNLNMRRDTALVLTDPAVGEMEIVQCPGTEVTIPGNGSWVLISLPVETGDRRANTLFPVLTRRGV